MEDEEAISYLSSLKGIGRWTAEMILLFCLQRKNIFSYNDLAIQRGLKMIYHHKKITKDLFENIEEDLVHIAVLLLFIFGMYPEIDVKI